MPSSDDYRQDPVYDSIQRTSGSYTANRWADNQHVLDMQNLSARSKDGSAGGGHSRGGENLSVYLFIGTPLLIFFVHAR
jgi:hypothetical protein